MATRRPRIGHWPASRRSRLADLPRSLPTMTPCPAAPAPPVPGVATIESFLDALRRSGALTAQQVATIEGRVETAEYPREPRGLARQLIRGGLLTDYQARRLIHGENPS